MGLFSFGICTCQEKRFVTIPLLGQKAIVLLISYPPLLVGNYPGSRVSLLPLPLLDTQTNFCNDSRNFCMQTFPSPSFLPCLPLPSFLLSFLCKPNSFFIITPVKDTQKFVLGLIHFEFGNGLLGDSEMVRCVLHLPGDAIDDVYPGREPKEDVLNPFFGVLSA